jgi:RHS repeat-associated protein
MQIGYSYDAICYKFTGKERDSETGLDYFEARYYSSSMGRFMQPDEFAGGPVDVFDPSPPTPAFTWQDGLILLGIAVLHALVIYAFRKSRIVSVQQNRPGSTSTTH